MKEKRELVSHDEKAKKEDARTKVKNLDLSKNADLRKVVAELAKLAGMEVKE